MFVLRCHSIVSLMVLIDITSARIFDRCDFVRTLRYKHNLSLTEINVWACIAQYQSGFDTEAIGYDSDGTGYHGMFQISDRYWCSTRDKINSCDVLCSQLLDEDLTDDFQCIKNIFEEHERISGNGYNAWTSYKNTCQYVYEGLFTNDCFVGDVDYIASTTESQQILNNKAIATIQNRIYNRCELARELRYVHQIPSDQIATWVCIAKRESNFNTSAIGSGDHGLFQISDIYWCSPPGRGWVCGLSCAKLEDSDITDDVECMKKIYEEHQRLSGDGFNAWSVYRPYCKNRSEQYIEGCFDNNDSNSLVFNSNDDELSSGETSRHAVKAHPGKIKIYERCELARELHKKHKVPLELVASYVCIAYYESKYNTSAVGHLNVDGSGDHGIFQISDIYWCSPPGMGRACGLSCDKLEDSDISNDVECMKKIYNEHQGLSGDGFNAWSVYTPYCKDRSDQFVDGCFHEISNSLTVLSHRPAITSPPNPHSSKSKVIQSREEKVFERCELANELRFTHNIPIEQISTWICIVKHESNYNTSALGRLNADGSKHHGLFQISDIYWCSPPGKGWVCGLSCEKLEDSDITDDVECMQKIYNEYHRHYGDGFDAWISYKQSCHESAINYAEGCFQDEFDRNVISSVETQPAEKDFNIRSKETKGKVYERCELARELKHIHDIPMDEVSNWVCIAYHESNYNTAAVGRLNADGSGDHGLFQISDIYWCSASGRGKGCSVSCSDLENSNITDDVQCIRQIFEEHTQISGDGFTAWSVYQPYCKGRTSQFTDGCFEETENLFNKRPAVTSPTIRPKKRLTSKINDQGKIYSHCELASELRDKYKFPEDQIATWVCIAMYESRLNTSAVGLNIDESSDHGIFQISDIYWCSPPGKGWACGLSCSELEDSDISNDVQCIKKIYEEHQKLSGDGFNAWTVYEPHCKDKSHELTKECFEGIIKATTTKTNERITVKAAVQGSVTTLSRFEKYATPITTTPLYYATRTKPTQLLTHAAEPFTALKPITTLKPLTTSKPLTTLKPFTTKIHTTTPSISTTVQYKTIPTISYQSKPRSSSSEVTYRPITTTQSERERVQSLFNIYFNGFQTPRPTTQKYLFPTTQRPKGNSVGHFTNFVSPLQSGNNSSSLSANKSISIDYVRSDNNSNIIKDLNASTRTGVVKLGVNVPTESTIKSQRNALFPNGRKVLSSQTPSTKLASTSNPTYSSYLVSSRNSLNSRISSPDTTTINPFLRYYTPSSANSKITYQSTYQRPSVTTIHSLPAYNSNRLTTTTTTTTKSPSIIRIINTHDNSLVMLNNRFTRAPSSSSTPNNNFKLTSSEHIQYQQTTTQNSFDKIFDLFVH